MLLPGIHPPYSKNAARGTYTYAGLLLVLLVALAPSHVQAQSIALSYEDRPLTEALSHLGTAHGIDFIYSVRLVENQFISCQYQGNLIEEALACVLTDAKIIAKRMHARQYILTSAATPTEQEAKKARPPPVYNLSGYIRDANTQNPLPGAHVFMPTIQHGAISDDFGYFKLPALPGSSFELRISYLGYETIDTTLTPGPSSVAFYLHPTTVEGTDILVEADTQPGDAYDNVPGLVSMNIETLDQAAQFGGEKDLLQTLQWDPGVQKGGMFHSGLLVRGGFPDQNLYLIDGAPVYHPWHAFNLISTFNTDAFKEVAFYKGSFPAQHGGRLSSVLETTLKDGNRDSPTARAGMSIISGRFLVESPLTRNSSFMFSGRRSYIDKLIGTEHPVQDANGARDTLRTGYHFSDITAKLRVSPSASHNLSFSYYGGADILDLRLPFNLSLDFSSWLQPAELFFEVDHNWGNRLYTFQHQYIPSSKTLITSTVYRSSYNANEGEFVQPTSSSSLRSQYHVRVRDWGFRSDIDYALSSRHHIQAGIHLVDHQFDSSIDALIFRSEGARDSLLQESSLKAFEGVTYVQNTWSPDSRWRIQPGLRISYFDRGSHLSFNPRLNIQHIVNPRYLILQGGLSTQVQYIQRLRDRYSFMYDLVSSRWIPTSDDIDPSESFQVALSGRSLPFSWLDLNVDMYWRTSRNVLLPRDVYQRKDGLEGPGIEVSSLLAQYTAGVSKAYGVEITSRIQYGPWNFTMNYSGSRTLSKAPVVDNGTYHPTAFDVPHFFRSSITRQYNRWRLTLSSLIRSGYPLTEPVAIYTLRSPGDPTGTTYLHRPDYNNGRLPTYLRFDISAGYDFELLGAAWTAQLHIFNATNRRNIIDRFFEPALPTIKITDRKGLPILPLFEIELAL